MSQQYAIASPAQAACLTSQFTVVNSHATVTLLQKWPLFAEGGGTKYRHNFVKS